MHHSTSFTDRRYGFDLLAMRLMLAEIVCLRRCVVHKNQHGLTKVISLSNSYYQVNIEIIKVVGTINLSPLALHVKGPTTVHVFKSG
jgi:hypothetical protein